MTIKINQFIPLFARSWQSCVADVSRLAGASCEAGPSHQEEGTACARRDERLLPSERVGLYRARFSRGHYDGGWEGGSVQAYPGILPKGCGRGGWYRRRDRWPWRVLLPDYLRLPSETHGLVDLVLVAIGRAQHRLSCVDASRYLADDAGHDLHQVGGDSGAIRTKFLLTRTGSIQIGGVYDGNHGS